MRIVAVAVVSGVGARGYPPAAGIGPAAAHPSVASQPTPVLLSVPAAPVPVPAAGRIALVYELHVANAGTRPLRIDRVEVRDADHPDARPIATYARPEVERNVKLIGPRGAPTPKTLSPNVRAVVYLWLAFDSSTAVPKALTHRVAFADGDSVDGARVSVRAPADVALEWPVGVGDWWIGLGPSNTSEHRRAVIRVGDDTVPHLAQRFAIDWVKMDARGEYARDHRGRRNTDWYGYGEPVLAVTDARVVAVVDSIPDNTPGEGSRAVPMRVATVLGNYVLLDLGPASGGAHRYALYGHLKPATLRVRVGDMVRPGQLLGAIGNSGNSDGPHLHFHVTEAADSVAAPLRSEGVPFVLKAFTVVSHDPERVAQHAPLTALGPHRAALPVEGDVVRVAGAGAVPRVLGHAWSRAGIVVERPNVMVQWLEPHAAQ
jgi:murein DD-endopeptidase